MDNLLQEAQKVDPSISRGDVEEFLEGERAYTLHKNRRTRYKRLRTVPAGYMTDVQVDLADFQKFAKDNDGNRYLLVGVDVMSRRIFASPTKSKETSVMIEAFKKLFEQMPCLPWRLFSDKGSELDGPRMIAFFKKMDVQKRVSQIDDTKVPKHAVA